MADEQSPVLRFSVRAAGSSDLTEAEIVLTRWWGITNLRANPLTEEERT